MKTRILRGDEARSLLRGQIEQHSAGLHAALSPFEAGLTVEIWLETLRAIEELINLALFGLDDEAVESALASLPIDAVQTRPRRLRAVCHHVEYRYGRAFARRLVTLLMQSAAIGMSFAIHGIQAVEGAFDTVGTAIGYFQSRRRHLVAMLYTLPKACQGSRRMHPLDALNHLLPLVELNGVTLTGLFQQSMLMEAFDDHALLVSAEGFVGSRGYPGLDAMYLEPERASIVEMFADVDVHPPSGLEVIRQDRLFSVAELRNDIRLLEAAYAEFDLAGSAFGPAAALVRCLADLAIDDHWVRIDVADFEAMADELGISLRLRRALQPTQAGYVANTNSYAPFVAVKGRLHSSVTLLSRFLYNWKNVCLYHSRRFQIRSGFIFEGTVARAVEKQGFRLTGIRRLNRKEFDVVTLWNGIVFNLQCKNNLIDQSRLEADPSLFARFNRTLSASYERALRKEVGRQALLEVELGCNRVEHLVITRFPVASDNPRIVPFSRIESLSSLAAELSAGRS